MKAKLFFFLITCFLLVMLFAACTDGEVTTDPPISSTVETTEDPILVGYPLDTEYFPTNIHFTHWFAAAPYHSDNEACIREFLTMLYACEFELIESPEIPDAVILNALPLILLDPSLESDSKKNEMYLFEMRIDPDAGILYQMNPFLYDKVLNVYRLTGFDKTLLEKLLATKEHG